MKRFKTEQEFIAEYGEEWRDGLPDAVWFSDTMNYLFGLPFDKPTANRGALYPDLVPRTSKWVVRDWMLTDKPHPYEGKEVFVYLNSDEERDMFLKRAEAMGYKLLTQSGTMVGVLYKGTAWLSFHISAKCDYILSFDQFRKGNLPANDKSEMNKTLNILKSFARPDRDHGAIIVESDFEGLAEVINNILERAKER